MTVEDRLLMLDVLLDVRVRLAPDGERLAVSGAPDAVRCATPVLLQIKPEIVAHLRGLAVRSAR